MARITFIHLMLVLKSSPNHGQDPEMHPRKRSPGYAKIFIVPGILMTKFATRESIDKGGPLGDLLMWADVITGLYALGHNVTLLDNKETANSRLTSLLNMPINVCSIPDVIVFVDILAISQLSFTIRRHLSCRFRVLDAYGTEAAYNDPVYSHKHGYHSPWGRLSLNLKQFFTFYLGKHLIYVTPKYHWPYIEAIARNIDVYSTMSSSTRIPRFVRNLGVMSAEEYDVMLSKTKVLFGLGYPFESSGALESLARGCVFLNPKFSAKDNDVLRSRTYRKPTSRKMTSQVPYMETDIGPPYVYTVKPYVPFEFSIQGYLERLSVIVEHQDFCRCVSSQWPPLSAMTTHLGTVGQSCTEVCQHHGTACRVNPLNEWQTYCLLIMTQSTDPVACKVEIFCSVVLDHRSPYEDSAHVEFTLQNSHIFADCVSNRYPNRKP
ncbi:hypothetical protein LSH36_660g06018 [Paralvinella palmiformis]|uniref:alpha-1,6-mannosyl-glycoprotein 6-beta-N-acetylglucosaminyltransferase n=1 Tax=Paralvinella palmiformis TaxID=53620 RepID=A0AAD9J439_9ANNE|nr:hypothetical protein LSH36_660g06018 [Paralvinella palmiformis]